MRHYKHDEKMLEDMIRTMRSEQRVHGYIPFNDRDMPYKEFCLRYPEMRKYDLRWNPSGAAFKVIWRYAWYHIHAVNHRQSVMILLAIALLVIGGAS